MSTIPPLSTNTSLLRNNHVIYDEKGGSGLGYTKGFSADKMVNEMLILLDNWNSRDNIDTNNSKPHSFYPDTLSQK